MARYFRSDIAEPHHDRGEDERGERPKDMPLDDIFAAIRVIAAGDSLIAPSVTRRLIEEFVRRPEPAPAPRHLDSITEREREVLTLVGRGMSNAEIATRLCITPTTVKTYVGRLLAKLGARDRVHLVIIAYETGLVGYRDDR